MYVMSRVRLVLILVHILFFFVYRVFLLYLYLLVGVPSFYFYHLYSNRQLIQTREQVCPTAAEEKHRLLRLRPLRILFDVYKPQFWYWEVIETIYRLSLTGVLVLINQGSSLQIIMGLLFSLLFIRIYETSCPYEDEVLQQIKNISLVRRAFLRRLKWCSGVFCFVLV